ncbi:MAG: glycoside hydrolase [Fibrobacteres bacterium]|nr:glycoside hydrolase [Fibrobacterota bacterium]
MMRFRPMRRFPFPVFAALAALLMLGSPVKAATAYNITVDAGKGTSPLNRFWENCVGSDHFYTVLHSGYGGNIQSAYAVAKKELGMKSVRAHGILNDDVGIYKEDGAGNPSYNWKNYDSIMDFITSLGWRPIVELSFMPSALASGTTTTCWYNGKPANVTPPKDYVKWKNLVTEIIKHSVERYTAAEVEAWRWEVWNEPDIKPQFFTGSEDDYFRMYDYAAEGAIAANPNIRIGGPATALSDTAGMLKRFLNHCLTTNYAAPAKKSTKVDFISWHQYPWNEGDQNPTGFAGRNRGIVAFLKRYPTLKLENLQTEWNASARYNYFDDEANASFVVKSIHSLFADQNQGAPPPDVFSFWVISDIFEENNLSSTSAYAGAMGMILRQRDAKKPSFNAFRMLHMLGDSTLSVTGGTTSDRGLNGLATFSKDKSQVQVLIYDHNYGSGNNPSISTVADMVHLQINNLPFIPGKMKIERYGVDKTHSNSFTTWVNQGRPAKPSSAQWDALEADGTLKLLDSASTVTLTGTSFTKDYTQNQPGVTLLVLTGQSPTVSVAPIADGNSGAIALRGGYIGDALFISYYLPRKMKVSLNLVTPQGMRVSEVLSEAEKPAGAYRLKLGSVPVGAYYCILKSGGKVLKTVPVSVLRQ